MNPVALLHRALTSNLKAISVGANERTALQAEGIADPTLQRYVVWRRATIMMVVIATFLSAGVSAYRTFTEPDDQPNLIDTMADTFLEELEGVVPDAAAAARPDADKAEEEDDDEPQTAFSQFEDMVHLVSLWILPAAALAALLLRNKFRLSFRILVTAFVFSFFVPIFFALCPWSWWGYEDQPISPGKDPGAYVQDLIEGLLYGAGYLAKLLPAVLSLVPGVLKACLRVKTLLPQSLLPGWFIVVVAPFYGLFLLVVFVAIDQVTSDTVLVSVMLLLIAAHLMYAFRAKAFTALLMSDEDYARMAKAQMLIGALTALAGLIIVAALVTRDVMGVHFVGVDPEKSLLRPIELAEFVLEFLGRSLFVCALGADLFMRLNLTAWKQSKTLEGTDAAKAYDQSMAALQVAVER